MKRILLTACLACAAVDAGAVSRYTSTSMTCAQLRSALETDGAAIIQYQSVQSGLPRWDRYVADRRFCASDQTTDRGYVPTADNASCPVNVCVEIVVPESR